MRTNIPVVPFIKAHPHSAGKMRAAESRTDCCFCATRLRGGGGHLRMEQPLWVIYFGNWWYWLPSMGNDRRSGPSYRWPLRWWPLGRWGQSDSANENNTTEYQSTPFKLHKRNHHIITASYSQNKSYIIYYFIIKNQRMSRIFTHASTETETTSVKLDLARSGVLRLWIEN